MPIFLSPYIKVDCLDAPRFILRKPEKAFSIVASDWNARIKALIKAFQKFEANLEVEVAKRVKAIVENLGRNYAELQAHYQAAYLQFAGNPCDKKANEALARANEEIRRMEFKLREIEFKTEKFVQSTELRKKKARERGLKGLALHLERDSIIIDEIGKLVSEFMF